MGVWRDSSQPKIEETGALSYCDRILNLKSAARAVVGIVCSLDTGSLMGVITYDCQRNLSTCHPVKVDLSCVPLTGQTGFTLT
jgi:hypothetical protein